MKNVFKSRISSLTWLIVLSTIVLANQNILAQDSVDMSNVKLEIFCEDTIGVGEQLNIGYVLDYEDQFNPKFLELKIPEFETDCARLLYVGKSGTSTSHSTINGKMKTTHKVKWEAKIKAVKEGTFQTPNVTLSYQSTPLEISPKHKSVVISDIANIPAEKEHKKDTAIKIPDNAIFRLDAVLGKGAINLGDSVLLQVKLQSNQGLSEVKLETPLEIDDCFYENLESFTNQPVKTTVNGVECDEWIIYEYLLTPLKSGVIKIPEIKIKGNCIVCRDEPDSFWGSLPKSYHVPFRTHSNEIKLKVKKP